MSPNGSGLYTPVGGSTKSGDVKWQAAGVTNQAVTKDTVSESHLEHCGGDTGIPKAGLSSVARLRSRFPPAIQRQ